MLRSGLIAALVLLLVPSPAAAGRASVTLTACTANLRTASFEARMEQVAGSERMRLRWGLEARKAGRAWRRVAAPDLAGWRSPDPGTTRFVSERTVTELTGPSHYRAVVRFRWLDDDGRTVARATRRSRACWQNDHRPNLKPRNLLLEAGGRYLVLVANRGRSASGTFDLSITGLPTVVVGDLQPGEERWIEAVGPECQPGARVTATVDPLDLVDERNEADNAISVRCPSA
jgi:hypothetical protein